MYIRIHTLVRVIEKPKDSETSGLSLLKLDGLQQLKETPRPVKRPPSPP